MVGRKSFPALGFGIGLRSEHYRYVLEQKPKVDWFEVLTENHMVDGGPPLRVLEAVRTDYDLAFHGVSLSVGSTDALDREYLKRLKGLVVRFDPAWISDHLCWTKVGGKNLHDLLPLPYREDVARHVAERVKHVQDFLGRPILLENISSYLTFSDSTMTEWEFLAMVAEKADCGILLDVNNVFVNAVNHGFDALRYIQELPVDRVIQFHLGGHTRSGSILLDTHDRPVSAEVWSLYAEAVGRFGVTPTAIEWDENLPEFSVLQSIAERAKRIACDTVTEARRKAE